MPRFNSPIGPLLAAVAFAVAALPAPAGADTLTFDDIDLSNDIYLVIPNGYGGLNWGDFGVVDGLHYAGNPSGYEAGVVSGTNVAFNLSGQPAEILAVSGGSAFTFNSVYLTAAWNDDLQVTVQGYSGGTLQYDRTVTLSATSPTLFTFDYENVDELRFTSFGGTPHADYGDYPAYSFAMDDFTFNEAVPEPSSLAMGACASGLLGLLALRRKSARGGGEDEGDVPAPRA